MIRRRKKSPILLILLAQAALFMLTPLSAFADDPDGPCDYSDPYANNCPLDGYIWPFAIITVVVVAVYLYKRQSHV